MRKRSIALCLTAALMGSSMQIGAQNNSTEKKGPEPIVVKQGRSSTGLGNECTPILSANIQGGFEPLKGITFTMEGTTNLKDVKRVRIFHANTDYRFRRNEAHEIAIVKPAKGEIKVTFDQPITLKAGDNFFWITYDIDSKATEGNIVDAVWVSNTLGDNTIVPVNANPEFGATIFLSQATVLMCGDHGSRYYRIPAIETANDGTLVAVGDRRTWHYGDLPQAIDLLVNYSTDNGKTWSAPQMVMGKNDDRGYGDAAIVKNKNGRLIILAAAHKGIWGSTAADPARAFKTYSDDNGRTWSEPEDITNQLYGNSSIHPETRDWVGMFVSSGRGLCTRDGVLMFAAPVIHPNVKGFHDHVLVSYDNGDTFKFEAGGFATKVGDEAKVAELSNGDIMMSIRKGGKRLINISKDKGKTWGEEWANEDLPDPNCNGEIMLFTSKTDGYDKERMLHSNCDAPRRRNVTVKLSYDEGKTYPIKKTICPGVSAYSTLCKLKDGTIGCYFEDGDENMDLVFVRFSLDWLTNGKDKYTKPSR